MADVEVEIPEELAKEAVELLKEIEKHGLPRPDIPITEILETKGEACEGCPMRCRNVRVPPVKTARGKRVEAARMLGLPRRTFYNRLKRYDLG